MKKERNRIAVRDLMLASRVQFVPCLEQNNDSIVTKYQLQQLGPHEGRDPGPIASRLSGYYTASATRRRCHVEQLKETARKGEKATASTNKGTVMEETVRIESLLAKISNRAHCLRTNEGDISSVVG